MQNNQYSHIIDLLPTTVQLTETKSPAVINGYKQEPFEGNSFFTSLNDAQIPSKHTIQYYEVVGRRALYKDGWKAAAGHNPGDDYNKDVWELYNINEDFNKRNNLATAHPDKLIELMLGAI